LKNNEIKIIKKYGTQTRTSSRSYDCCRLFSQSG
jgi:hypothetical protein